MWITGRWGPIRSHQVGLVAPVGHRRRRSGRGSGAHRALPADRFRSDQVGGLFGPGFYEAQGF